MRKGLMYALVLLVALVPLLGSFLNEASAASSRVAIIKELKGTVKVKKSGGSKEFTAFAKMSLNEGDVLSVGSGGSAILQFSNGTSEDDRMTVAENTKLTFSKLSSKKGTTTKVSMWGGTAWVDVKSITNADDQFSLETPTAVMGVRGTHLLVNVDPETGATRLTVAAGIVSTSTPGGKAQEVYPTQNALITGDEDEDSDSEIVIAPADLEMLMQQTDASIIEAILRSAEEITRENEEYAARFQEELPEELGNSQSDIDRFKSNTLNLLGAIADQAVKSGILSEERLNQIVEEVKNQTGFTVDLDKKTLTTTDEEEQKKAKQREAEELKRKQAEEKKAREQQALEQQAELKRKLEETRLALEKAKQAAEEEKRRNAEEALKQRLSDEEKTRFEEQKQQRDREQSEAAQTPTTTPTPAPVTPAPTPTPPPAQSSNANLSGLSITANGETVTLSPGFAAGTTSYTATFPVSASQLSVAPIVEDTGKATVTVGGSSLSNGTITVNVGTAANYSLAVVVRAENGSTKTYTVALTRESPNVPPSNISTLASLKVNGQDVPGFWPGHETTSFTVAVAHDVASVSISATATDAVNATVAGTGSKSIELGDNSFTITVTAQDGSTREYTLHIVRTMVSAISLSYKNDYGTWSVLGTVPTNPYNLTSLHWKNPFEFSELRIVPEVAQGVTIVSVNGEFYEGGYFAATPEVGTNTYSIVTRATSGAELTYSMVIEREPLLALPRELASWTTIADGPIEWVNVGHGKFATHTSEAASSFTMSLEFDDSRGVTSAKLFHAAVQGQELAAWNASGDERTISGLVDGFNNYVLVFYQEDEIRGSYPLIWVNGPEQADWTALGTIILKDESTHTYLQSPSRSSIVSYFTHVSSDVSELRIQLPVGMNDQKLYLKGSSEPLTTSDYASYVVSLDEGYNEFEIVVTDFSGLFSAAYELTILRSDEIPNELKLESPPHLQDQYEERDQDAEAIEDSNDYIAYVDHDVSEIILTLSYSEDAEIDLYYEGEQGAFWKVTNEGGYHIPIEQYETKVTIVLRYNEGLFVYRLNVYREAIAGGLNWVELSGDANQEVWMQPIATGEHSYFASADSGSGPLRLYPYPTDGSGSISVQLNDGDSLYRESDGGYLLDANSGWNTIYIAVNDSNNHPSTIYTLDLWVGDGAPDATNLQGIELDAEDFVVPFTQDEHHPLRWNAIAMPSATEITLTGSLGNGAYITEASWKWEWDGESESISVNAGEDVTIPLEENTYIQLAVTKDGKTSVYLLDINRPNLPIGVAYLYASWDGEDYSFIPEGGAGGGSYDYRIDLGEEPTTRDFNFTYGFHFDIVRDAAYQIDDGDVEPIASNEELRLYDLEPGNHVITFTYEAKDPITDAYRDYTLTFAFTVSEPQIQSGTDILSFEFPELNVGAHINSLYHIITVNVDSDTDVSQLVASFELSPGATAYVDGIEQISGSSVNDFNSVVMYHVVAEDQVTTENWEVIVNVRQNLDDVQLNYGYGFSLPVVRIGQSEFIAYVGEETDGFDLFKILPVGSEDQTAEVYQWISGERTLLPYEEGYGYVTDLTGDEGWFDYQIEVRNGNHHTEYQLHIWRGESVPPAFAGAAFEAEAGNGSGVSAFSPMIWIIEVAAESEDEYVRFRFNPELDAELESMTLMSDGRFDVELLPAGDGWYELPWWDGESPNVMAVLRSDDRRWAYEIRVMPEQPVELFGVRLFDASEDFAFLGNMEVDESNSMTYFKPREVRDLYVVPIVDPDWRTIGIKINNEPVPYDQYYSERAGVFFNRLAEETTITITVASPSGLHVRSYTLTLIPEDPISPLPEGVASWSIAESIDSKLPRLIDEYFDDYTNEFIYSYSVEVPEGTEVVHLNMLPSDAVEYLRVDVRGQVGEYSEITNLPIALEEEDPYTNFMIEYKLQGAENHALVYFTVLQGEPTLDRLYGVSVDYSEGMSSLEVSPYGENSYFAYVGPQAEGHATFMIMPQWENPFQVLQYVDGEWVELEDYGWAAGVHLPLNEEYYVIPGWYDFQIVAWDRSMQRSEIYPLHFYVGNAIPQPFSDIQFIAEANPAIGVSTNDPSQWYVEVEEYGETVRIKPEEASIPVGVNLLSVHVQWEGTSTTVTPDGEGYYTLPPGMTDNDTMYFTFESQGREFVLRVTGLTREEAVIDSVTLIDRSDFGMVDAGVITFVAGQQEASYNVPAFITHAGFDIELLNDNPTWTVKVDGNPLNYSYGGSRYSWEYRIEIGDGVTVEIEIISPSGYHVKTYTITLGRD